MAWRQLVYMRCTDRKTVEYYRQCYIGVRGDARDRAGRMDILPAEASDQNPLSLNIEFPDFRGEEDLVLLRALPGVLEAGTFEAGIQLPDPREARRAYYAAERAAAA